MSESEIYYGSANFSMDSLENKIEVATFRQFLKNDILKKEFIDFVQDSMKRMQIKSNRRNIWGVIRENDNLIQSAQTLIQKLNPSIEKVVNTINSIISVRTIIAQIIENTYWFLDDKYYYELTKIAYILKNILKKINYTGNHLLASVRKQKDFNNKVYSYNYQCKKFKSYLQELSEASRQLLLSEKKVPYFTKKIENLSVKMKNY